MSHADIFNAVANNNRGANLVDEGDYLSALPEISSALRCVKNGLRDCIEDEQEGSFDLDSLMAKPREALVHASRNNDGYFVYDQAIRIPELFSAPTSHDKQVCAAISIFNLALAHHLHGLTTTHKSEVFLIKAAKLYEFGIQVQQGVVGNALCSFFYLVILNNLADVERRLGNDSKSLKFCEEVLEMLMLLADSQNEPSKDESATLEVFYQNSFFYLLSARFVNAAPAA